VKYLFNTIAAALIFVAASLSVFGQETDTSVVDEVVAQVNNGVITLSKVKREMKNIVDSEVQQGKDRATVQKAVDAKQGELIANLINEELMIEKAKEEGIEKEADAEVNQRFLQVMKQYGLKTIEALYKEMEKNRGESSGDPRDVASAGNSRNDHPA
jgi:parvulin-like peptidyl-prolyl isomerase